MYSSVHCRRQSVSCCSRSSVEQSSIARHCCPLSPSSAVVLNHISSHFLIPFSDSSLIYTVSAQWLVILDTIIVFTLFNILHFNEEKRENRAIYGPTSPCAISAMFLPANSLSMIQSRSACRKFIMSSIGGRLATTTKTKGEWHNIHSFPAIVIPVWNSLPNVCI